MTAKGALIDMIRRLPDDATSEDILYAIYVRVSIDEGIRQLNRGEFITHEEVMQRLNKRWLTQAAVHDRESVVPIIVTSPVQG